MPRAIISLLRGVNVGGHNKLRMEDLRALYESLGLAGASTYVQSGNVVFRAPAKGMGKLAGRIAEAIKERFGIECGVILRTLDEWKSAIERNPFEGIEPGKLIVLFMASDPAAGASQKLNQLTAKAPEEVHLDGREAYVHFPNGSGQAKLTMAAIERALVVPATGRNWNTIARLRAMAEEIGE